MTAQLSQDTQKAWWQQMSCATTWFVVICTLLFPATLLADAPRIANLSPTSGAVGTPITVSGSHFGSSQGASTVAFNGTIASPISWSDGAITVEVPSAASSGNLVVTVDGESSNGVAFAVTSNGYGYVKAVVIHHEKVSNTDQANFPVLVSGTFADLANVASGGKVQNTQGYDIIFTSDAAGASPLPFELESYSSSTGAVAYWVQVPTLSHATDTVVYMFYGNSSVTSDQSNRAGVWDANYAGVWHLGNGTTLSAADSTGNGRNGTISGATVAAGQIGGGAYFNGSSVITIPSIGSVSGSYTIEEWASPASTGGTYALFGSRSPADQSFDAKLMGYIHADIGDGSSWLNTSANANFSYSANAWHHFVYTVSSSGYQIYADGAPIGSGSLSGTPLLFDTNHNLLIGNSGYSEYFFGTIDEMRASSTVRSADWIATEFNNQSSPSTFATISAVNAPLISSVSPNAGAVGTTVTIAGSGFGATQGSGVVTFNGVAASPATWSDAAITVSVPSGATSGNVVVTANGEVSNGIPFTVNAHGYGYSYGYEQAIVIDHTKVPNTDQVNFPVLISGAYPDLASVANGGKIQSTQGYDILFTSDAAGANLLPFEQESYSASTGAIAYWVQVPTVSHTADTVIYVFYGNSSVTSDQSNKTGVWDSSYVGVWHLANGTTLSATDSTGNSRNGAISGAIAANGLIDGAASFNGSSVITIPSSGSLSGTFTIEGWANPNTTSGYLGLFGSRSPWDASFDATLDGSGLHGDIGTGTSWLTTGADASFSYTANSWHHVAYALSSSGYQIYADGRQVGTGTFNGSPLLFDANHTLQIGNSGAGEPFNGVIDEVRVSNTSRSADWIATEFNNQSSPATFFSITPVGSSGGPSITSLSPDAGAVGAVITITGSTFGLSQGASTVTFNGVAATPTRWSDSSITATVPSGATTGSIVVTVNGVASNGAAFTILPPPTITGLSSNSAQVGVSITISGSGFGDSQGTSVVSFNGTAATSTSWSDTSIAVPVPVGGTSGNVVVTVAGLPSNGIAFTVLPSLTISGISPAAAASGATVAIVGSGFGSQGQGSSVSFGGSLANVVSWSDEAIRAVVPGLSAGSVIVTVTSQGVSSNGASFTVEGPPAVSAVSPTNGPGGTVVTIDGSGFGATQSTSTIAFDGVAAGVSSWSDTEIVAVVPQTRTGAVSVTVGGLVATGPDFQVTTIAVLTNSQGNQTTYVSTMVGGTWVLLSAQGPGCSSCSVRNNVQNTYDGNGNLQTTTDANGNTITYTYDGNNNVLSKSAQFNGAAVTTSYTYNSFGEVLTSTDPLGNTTANTYDAHGNLTSVTSPAPNAQTSASVTQFAYNSLGEMTQITDPLNNLTTLTYTSAGLIASITDAQQNVTSYQYDARGNRTAVIDPINGTSHPTTFTYDVMNRLTGITYPNATSVSFGYDYRGRRTSATDQNSHTATYAYDDADRLLSVTDAANNVTQYAYDTEGNLTSITDANNHTTQFSYDAFGRVIQTTFPSTLIETYGYDPVGNLTSKTDRKGQTIQYVYDALYRLTNKIYPDSTSANYVYDLVGKTQQVSDPTGVYGFAYDNMGRLIGTTTQYSFLPGYNYQNNYTYDLASNRRSFTAPDGSTTSYGYDNLNRMNTLANSWAGSFGFVYDALNRRTQIIKPNGMNTNYTYDSSSNLLSILHQIGSTVLDGASYSYDAAGYQSSKTNVLDNNTSNYSYDGLYQLQGVSGGTTESYTYDAVGNRMSSFGVPTYSYNSSNELLSDAIGSYKYDSNGNTLSDPQGRNFTWDFENRLKQVVVPGVNGGTTTFRYDPFGRRVQKSGPLGTTNYVYDIANVVEVADSGGSALVKYSHEQTIDQPLAELYSGTKLYYQADSLGSITSLTDSSAMPVDTYVYDALGNLLASTGSSINDFRYTGRELDPESGLYYYRARYYDPAIGRFISEDPIRFDGGSNFYAYVWNDPIGYADPLGLCPPTPKPPFIAYPPVKPCDTSGSRDHGYPAVDIRTRHQYGLPIYATEDGIVSKEFSGGYNSPYPGPPAPPGSTDYVTVRTYSGNYIKYVHVTPALQPGSLVNAGDVIGYNDDTGRQSGPHVHMEINHDGHRIDPSNYLQFSCSAYY